MGSDIERSMALTAVCDLATEISAIYNTGAITEEEMESIENLLTIIGIYIRNKCRD